MAKNDKAPATRRTQRGVSKAQLNSLRAALDRSNARIKTLNLKLSQICIRLGLDEKEMIRDANRSNVYQRGESE